MMEPADPPSLAHRTTKATGNPSTFLSASDSLRARQLDRFATRSKPARLPLKAKPTVQEREVSKYDSKLSGILTSSTSQPHSSITPSTSAPLSKSSYAPARDGVVSTTGTQRLNNRTFGYGADNTTISNRGNGSTFDNRLIDDSLISGKEGRSFTVGKVGGGGKIYLRPSVRPAYELYKPKDTSSMSANATAGLEALLSANLNDENHRDSMWSNQSRSTTPAIGQNLMVKAPKHRRAYSHSTIDEQQGAAYSNEFGAIKVVIERPSADGRPKTSGGSHTSFPTLEVPIPSYKLGTPRFSVRGTPFLRGSSYAPSDADFRSSIMSGSQRPSFITRRDSRSFHPATPQPQRQSLVTSPPAERLQVYELRLPPKPANDASGPKPSLNPGHSIVPEIFDVLSTPPMCEDRSVIRRNLAGQISAATPARLIAEVTQELNYELVASFFITYRSYIPASDLLNLVMARLQHGINQGNKGIIVTVRCFTVIRHWLVNFFIDDFVLDYDLRVQFCELVNEMVQRQALMRTNSKTTNDILSNIKRLWRDSCATYWDGPEFDVELGALVPISPGGVAGSRDPNLIPEAFGDLLLSKAPKVEVEGLSRLSKAPILEVDVEHDSSASGTHGYFASIPLEYPAEFDKVRQQSIIMPLGAQSRKPSYPESPTSPRSNHSIEAFSCSFPIRSGQNATGSVIRPHPISAQAGASATSIARPPKPMRSNSKRGPRRNRSISNSSRPERPRSEGADSAIGETEIYFADRFAGSLIRGLVYLPPPTYLPAGEPWDSRPSSLPIKKANSHKCDGHHSGGGMKKMFGTVRRAVSKSEGGDKPQNFPHLSIAFEQTAAVGCAAGAAVVQHCFRPPVKGMTMRPDKLGQFVEKDFESVVEQHKAELAKTEVMAKSCLMDFGAPQEEPILQHTETSSTIPLPGLISSSKRAWADEQSRDKTGFLQDPPDEYAAREDDATISGALPPLQITPFSETSLYLTINPTPPVTPPEQCHGRARHSSQLLGAASTRERTPSLAHGLGSPVSDDLASQRTVRSMKYPTMASFGRDSRSHLRRSTSLRRIASFQSGYSKHMRETNFDATTFSESRDRVSVNSVNSTHPPANRILKRRPGGDLRAANTVKDLPQRSRSADSVATYSTYSASLRSSFKFGSSVPAPHLDAASPRASEEESRPFSVGALADPDGTSRPKPHISLFSTDSKPVMRASFQAEAAKLAQIPDDADDDGGVESALLKLEGKFEQRRSQITDPHFTEDLTTSSEVADRMFEGTAKEASASPGSVLKQTGSSSYPIRQSPLSHLAESEVHMAEAAIDSDVTPTEIPRGAHEPTSELESFSRNDYVCRNTPLLQRESEYFRYDQPLFREGPQSSVLSGPSTIRDVSYQGSQSSLRPRNDNYDHESLNNITYHSEYRQRSAPQSFLGLEDDVKSSDRSRKVSSEVKFSEKFPPAKRSSPSARNENMTPRLSQTNSRGEFFMEQAGLLPIRQAVPPTPEGTPTIPARNTLPLKSRYGEDMLEVTEKGYTREHVTSGGAQIIDEHMPFILSFPSALLAQQFTIIEMEALSEIHFRELLEMKWSHDAATSSRSWPRFLQQLSKVEEDDSVSHGIEICAARSSIMTNWAISQVVLTSNLEERAKTITKLIHVANECRQLGNYATLFQITVALTNPILAELSETWSRVSAVDIELLSSFESLIQPANNFRRLRDEMEVVLGRGPCIPLIAVYAKDLKAMGDMPSYVANHWKNEDWSLRTPLINVGKCRAQAAVVQLVARYLEGIGEMRIRPVQGVIERCLWVGGLREEEVRTAARGLL